MTSRSPTDVESLYAQNNNIFLFVDNKLQGFALNVHSTHGVDSYPDIHGVKWIAGVPVPSARAHVAPQTRCRHRQPQAPCRAQPST